ncbi:DUF4176 domain-containing protein [Bacillus sp. REN3]|uniref:DUF4176 domain-containing protein n=1 Tax=Bacillus sp. REN3 TaxID=2802440 RepID=UPI001AEEC786
MEIMKKYLPIGSIVLLKGGTKRIMIYGRQQKEIKSDKIWDYIACLYPEGNLNEDYMFLFNHDQIEKVFFIGFQDEEEIEFVNEILKSKEA